MTRREKYARDLDLAFATMLIGIMPVLTMYVAYAEHPNPPVEYRPARAVVGDLAEREQERVLRGEGDAWWLYPETDALWF